MSDRRDAPLALSTDAFRALAHRLVDRVADGLAQVSEGRITPGETAAEVNAALGLGGPLPEQGKDAGALLDRAATLLFEHSLFNGHPKFFGYITASPAPIGILGDFLASAVNANCGGSMLSPAATQIEVEVLRWIAQFLGYPDDCGGILVSGGNMANFIGFWTARAAMAERLGWDVRAKGAAAPGAPRLVAYTSAETHTWIQKAADLSGLGTEAVRWIPTDADLRMDVAALRAAIAADRNAGLAPFLVVGTGGSVSTGAIDPLPALADLCAAKGLWFHVDGAYGGFAAGLPDAPADLKALARADSVAIDPHKWLYMPLEVGCALVRDKRLQMNAFSYHPPYYHLDGSTTNFVDFGMQNSRGFRALKVWLALQQVGAAGYRQMIGDDVKLARRMAAAAARESELEAGPGGLSIATFRYVPADLRARTAEPSVAEYLNALNQEIIDRTQKEGEVFVSPAVIGGRYLLRACIVNIHTQAADVEAAPGLLVQRGRAIDSAMRAAALGGGARA
jgi:glutamate/tyrosine decarboxylase-like PLP-dependent enzyme